MEWIGPELLLWVQPALSALLSPVPRARGVSELSEGLGSSASSQRPGMTTEHTAMPASSIDTPDMTAVQINEFITFFLNLSLTRVSPGLAARPPLIYCPVTGLPPCLRIILPQRTAVTLVQVPDEMLDLSGKYSVLFPNSLGHSSSSSLEMSTPVSIEETKRDTENDSHSPALSALTTILQPDNGLLHCSAQSMDTEGQWLYVQCNSC